MSGAGIENGFQRDLNRILDLLHRDTLEHEVDDEDNNR